MRAIPDSQSLQAPLLPKEASAQEPATQVGMRAGVDIVQAAFREHGPFIRRLIQRLVGAAADADDLTQEVFLVAFKKRRSFEADIPRVWLYGVALRVASAARRRSRVRRMLGLDAVAGMRAPDVLTRGLEQADARREVYAVLDKLSERKRTAFILYELEGMSGEEIAEVLRCPVQTVWTRLFHARREFVALLSKMRELP